MNLPLFLDHRNKYLYWLPTVLLGVALYILSNRLLLFPAHLLPLSPIDRAVPFIPETVWIYNSDVALFIIAYVMSKDMENANKCLYAFFAALIVSIATFLLWPTTYPRDLFPLPSTLDPWTEQVFSHLRNADKPTNCLPSLHVSMSYLSAFIYIGEQRGKFLFFMTWATVIAVTTLTTKQHYLADVLTGLGLAAMMYFIFHRFFRYKKLNSTRTF